MGDFSQIWYYLDEVDPCGSNYTPQVAFIDDGLVVPGVGPTICLNWCYGPAGYIVNTNGGLAGGMNRLHNQVRSPVVAWPQEDLNGAIFAFNVFQHEDLTFESAGVFYTWQVRSVNTGDPADLDLAPWRSRDVYYYGPARYLRFQEDVSDLLVAGATHVQVGLSVEEMGPIWGWLGDDATPAPYFDNVRLTAYRHSGPALSARPRDLAQDAFPASGEVDLNDLAGLSVRFDMAANIAPATHDHLDPGDSVVITVSPLRVGAVLSEPPSLHYLLDANPVFNDYRSSGLPLAGSVAGVQVDSDRYAFDLPDTGFFFPGDRLHYFFSVSTEAGGEVQTAILPADTTGFSNPQALWLYDREFTVRALPSVGKYHDGELYRSAENLLWVDGNDEEIWTDALGGVRVDYQRGYDLFVTREPEAGLGNGLGGRATLAQLDGYDGLLYSAGELASFTLCNGDLNRDGSDDLGLLDAWLQSGTRTLLVSGDNVASDLAFNQGPRGQAFVDSWLGLDVVASNLRPLINNQVVPLVLTQIPLTGFLEGWVAYGGCLGINAFDAVVPTGGGVSLAEFTDPSGQTGVYDFSALVYNDTGAGKDVWPSRQPGVFTLPMGLEYVYADPSLTYDGACSAREALLVGLLDSFGVPAACWGVGPVDLPSSQMLTASNYPNPFNPSTVIAFDMPGAGHLKVQVFDVAGRLVSTLKDEQVPAGPGQVTWAGRDGRGAEVSSGVYFYRVEGAGQTLVQKMALIK